MIKYKYFQLCRFCSLFPVLQKVINSHKTLWSRVQTFESGCIIIKTLCSHFFNFFFTLLKFWSRYISAKRVKPLSILLNGSLNWKKKLSLEVILEAIFSESALFTPRNFRGNCLLRVISNIINLMKGGKNDISIPLPINCYFLDSGIAQKIVINWQ